jgi:hypothetical protein
MKPSTAKANDAENNAANITTVWRKRGRQVSGMGATPDEANANPGSLNEGFETKAALGTAGADAEKSA